MDKLDALCDILHSENDWVVIQHDVRLGCCRVKVSGNRGTFSASAGGPHEFIQQASRRERTAILRVYQLWQQAGPSLAQRIGRVLW